MFCRNISPSKNYNVKDWQKFEWNNKSIAVNVLFRNYRRNKMKIEEIKRVYISKHNFSCENKVILLMITQRKNGSKIVIYIITRNYIEK